jgi:hypothetical protein
MRRLLLLAVAIFGVVAIGLVDSADAGGGMRRQMMYQAYPWHAGYYDAAWGMPVALVVPPTASYQTNWGWGVGNTRVTPIFPQFGRDYPGPGYYDSRAFRPKPLWPSDTLQFGTYYVRGPW